MFTMLWVQAVKNVWQLGSKVGNVRRNQKTKDRIYFGNVYQKDFYGYFITGAGKSSMQCCPKLPDDRRASSVFLSARWEVSWDVLTEVINLNPSKKHYNYLWTPACFLFNSVILH